MRLFKAHTKQYNKTKFKKNLPNFKIAEKPAKWYKKIILMTRNLQTTVKTTLKIIQYHNQTSKPKNKQKTVLKTRT